MNNTDLIKTAPVYEAKDELKKIVVYAYTALGQKPADQTIEMSVDFIYDKVSHDTTLQEVKNIIKAALDTTENRQINPKWFADVIRTSKSGINRPQDWEEDAAPKSTGDEQLDTKINMVTMFTLHKLGHNHYSCNWRVQYAFLLRHNIITEYGGWLAEWTAKAKSHILAKSDNRDGSLRQIMSDRSYGRDAVKDEKLVQETVYELRVRDIIERAADKMSFDGFCQWFNNMTSELAPVFAILDDTSLFGFYIQYTINGQIKKIR